MVKINSKNILINTVITYILFIIALLVTKPKFIFEEETNRLKTFGCGPGKTLITFPMIGMCGVLIIYVFFSLLSSSDAKPIVAQVGGDHQAAPYYPVMYPMMQPMVQPMMQSMMQPMVQPMMQPMVQPTQKA